MVQDCTTHVELPSKARKKKKERKVERMYVHGLSKLIGSSKNT